MAWTAPKTYAVGDVLTASDMNAFQRDNLLETAPAKAAAAGDMFHATAANAIAALTIGGATGLLTSSATAPEWKKVAWASVASDGTLQSNSYGISGVVRDDTGNYSITLSVAFGNANYVIVATVEPGGVFMRVATSDNVVAGSFDIDLFNQVENEVDEPFHFFCVGDH